MIGAQRGGGEPERVRLPRGSRRQVLGGEVSTQAADKGLHLGSGCDAVGLFDEVPLLVRGEAGEALHGGQVLREGHAEAQRQVGQGIEGVHSVTFFLGKTSDIASQDGAGISRCTG